MTLISFSKRAALVFLVQIILLSTLTVFLGKSIADSDAVSPIADFGYWEVLTDSFRLAFLAALIVAFTFGLVQLLATRHLQVGFLDCLLLTTVTIVFLILDIFIVRDLGLVPVSFSITVSHVLSWMVLLGPKKVKGVSGLDG